ncbi:MAG: Gfo/Idh/MocA family oxidoreductase, partial [Gemmatimonadetes bacterium]|nr:Gfo/Idh/MocA family oxidoreductase [Gemmatimonadota bacterium]
AVFTPGTLHALALLQGDELPEPQVGRAKSIFPMTEAHHRASPARIWRASKAAGGGCIGDTGYHEIYSLETLMCSPVRYVEARVQTRFFDIDVDDVALLLLEHENGAISTVSTSWGMVGGGAGELGGLCEVHTRGDCLRVVGRGRALHRFSRETGAWSEIPLDVTERNRTGHADYLTATFAALSAGDPPPITGAEAYHNLSIIEAARRATQARRAIDLTEL